MEASIPGSLPGSASRNGRPEGTYYTRWRGRPLPVVPYTERNLGGRPPSTDTKSGKCAECGCWPQSKKHHRQCLGVELPPSPGHPGHIGNGSARRPEQ